MIAYSYMRQRRAMEREARRANVRAALCLVFLFGGAIVEALVR